MNSSHMKPLQLILINVTEKLTAYFRELEEKNERTKKSHEKSFKTITVEDFGIRSISISTSIVENVWSNRFVKIRELFQNKDLCDPVVMNVLIQVTNQTMLMATINHMTEKGLPFKLKVIQSAITDCHQVALTQQFTFCGRDLSMTL